MNRRRRKAMISGTRNTKNYVGSWSSRNANATTSRWWIHEVVISTNGASVFVDARVNRASARKEVQIIRERLRRRVFMG